MLKLNILEETPSLLWRGGLTRIALLVSWLAAVAAAMPVHAGTVTLTGNSVTDTTNLNAEIAAANASGTPVTITIAASGLNDTLIGKYPPAKPGALELEPLEAAIGALHGPNI